MDEQWKVNDRAAYHMNNRSLYGTVVQVNRKSVRVRLDDQGIGDPGGITTWRMDDRLLHRNPGNPGPLDVFEGTPMTYVPIMLIDKTPITSRAMHKPKQLTNGRWNVHLEDWAELVFDSKSCKWSQQAQ